MSGRSAQAGGFHFLPDNRSTKSELRRAFRARRRALPERERRAAADALARRAIAARLVRPGRCIAFFLPNDGEIDLLPLLNRALWMRATCFLPILPIRRKRRLVFGRVGDRTLWRVNRFGILEPGGRRHTRAHDLDLILVPLVAFDDGGFRVGMGGGYYDATLEFLRHRANWRRPRIIGAAYDMQRVAAVPHDPWDMPLDAVLTERGLRRFQPRNYTPAMEKDTEFTEEGKTIGFTGAPNGFLPDS